MRLKQYFERFEMDTMGDGTIGVLPILSADVVGQMLRDAGWRDDLLPAGVARIDPEGDSTLVDADNRDARASVVMFTQGREELSPPPLERLDVLINSGRSAGHHAEVPEIGGLGVEHIAAAQALSPDPRAPPDLGARIREEDRDP